MTPPPPPFVLVLDVESHCHEGIGRCIPNYHLVVGYYNILSHCAIDRSIHHDPGLRSVDPGLLLNFESTDLKLSQLTLVFAESASADAVLLFKQHSQLINAETR